MTTKDGYINVDPLCLRNKHNNVNNKYASIS